MLTISLLRYILGLQYGYFSTDLPSSQIKAEPSQKRGKSTEDTDTEDFYKFLPVSS